MALIRSLDDGIFLRMFPRIIANIAYIFNDIGNIGSLYEYCDRLLDENLEIDYIFL